MCVRTHAQEKTLWIWRWKTGLLLLLDAARVMTAAVSEVAKLAVGANQQMPCPSQPQTAHSIRKRTLKGTEHTCKLQSRHMVIIHIYRIYDQNTARAITPGLPSFCWAQRSIRGWTQYKHTATHSISISADQVSFTFLYTFSTSPCCTGAIHIALTSVLIHSLLCVFMTLAFLLGMSG